MALSEIKKGQVLYSWTFIIGSLEQMFTKQIAAGITVDEGHVTCLALEPPDVGKNTKMVSSTIKR